jgi:uncharacterized protein (TIGR00730 family)
MPDAAMNRIKNVCVYCGSGPGTDPAYEAAAEALGAQLAKAGIGLVYGGGSLGLMGTVARSVLEAGGHVTGIIPDFLSTREKMLKDVQELVVTKDMHERKKLMFEKSDAFVALPGGVGTLEETVEMLTWSQLGRHKKPILLANVKQFWVPLIELFEHMRAQEFIRQDLMVRYLVADRIADIVPMLQGAAEMLADRKPGEGAPSLGNL